MDYIKTGGSAAIGIFLGLIVVGIVLNAVKK